MCCNEMRHIFNLVVMMVLLSLSVLTQAAESNTKARLSVDWLEVKDKSTTVLQIASLPLEQFSHFNPHGMSLGFRHHPVWLRIDIENVTVHAAEYWLDLVTPRLAQVLLYQQDEQQQWHTTDLIVLRQLL